MSFLKKEKLPDGFTCPDEEVLGPNGRPLPHPTFPHPDDCQQFYICRNAVDPQPGSCPPGTVYNDISYRCDDPENVPGWSENYCLFLCFSFQLLYFKFWTKKLNTIGEKGPEFYQALFAFE